MSLRPYESRMPAILRLAPYVDVAVVRQRMENAVKRLLKNNTHMNDEYRTQYEAFLAGDSHVIPMAFQLDTKLLKILERIAGNRLDRRFHEAFREFIKYFFYSDARLGIG